MFNPIIVYILFIFAALLFFTVLGYKLKLVDIPNKRKVHKKPITFIGGFAISIIYIFSLQYFDMQIEKINLIFSLAVFISIIGLIDDISFLSVNNKLSLQIIPIFYLIFIEKIFLENIGDYGYFEIKLGVFGLIFTLFCVLLLINSFNYFDGLDGTLSYTSISVLIILYFLVPLDSNLRFLIIIIFLPICIFLLFNHSFLKLPKLFLGDSGSLLLGFITSFLLIYLAESNLVHPILLAWSVSIFVYEFLSINFIRIKNKKNPFKAGLDHLHHILKNKTKSLLLTNFLIFTSNVTLFLFGYLVFKLINPLTSLLLFILLFFVFLILRKKFI